ncbi:condensation domain-containing protein [Rugosimonospora africana]|uniref:Condensation domain-containing protein n=1 Tax=Rugosimonospora africana TaxID=556532 RepID=A0A8J3VUU7_9ACTN|nr:condensation domain-containing protein [Rugosimonospora africana]GIH19630.1 hypothetical protein Raf01_78020 [Rugosimonospora africana]
MPESSAAAVDRPTDQEAGFLILHRLLPDVGMANVFWVFECAESFRTEDFQTCLTWLVRRHPRLRTYFPTEAGEPARRTLGPDAVRVTVEQLDAPEDPTEAARRFGARPIDITSGMPVAAAVIHGSDRTSPLVVLVIHHVAVDADATGVLLDELDTCFRSVTSGAVPPSEVVQPPSTREVVAPSEDSVDFWRETLDGVDSRAMMLDVQRDLEPRTFAAQTLYHQASAEATASARALCASLGMTRNMVLMTAFYALMSAHRAGPDLTIGTLVRWQDEADEGPSVDHRTSTLALRIRADPACGFRELAGEVAQGLFEGLVHADVPFEQVVPALRTVQGGWRVPVFRQVFNYLPVGTDLAPGSGPLLSFGRWLPMGKNLIRYELEFNISDRPDTMLFSTVYSTELFDEPAVVELMRRFERILIAANRNPDVTLSEL